MEIEVLEINYLAEIVFDKKSIIFLLKFVCDKNVENIHSTPDQLSLILR